MKEVIRTEKLTKSFGDVLAVNGVSLNVRKGEIYGFLGLNGAGKTTTIRMLLGLIKPTNGEAYINDQPVTPANTNLWKDIGYLVEIPYSYPDLTVRENLDMIRRLRFIDDPHAVDSIMEKMRISSYANRKARTLSLGNAQRLGLAKALIHNPGILILDEPSNGLDPSGIFEIRELLKELAHHHQTTIFISSHILDEISRFATRIGIIHNGELIRELNSSDLISICEKRLKVDTVNNAEARTVLSAHDITFAETDDNKLEIRNDQFIQHPEIIAGILVSNNVPPCLLAVEEEDLESYFLRTITTFKNHE